MNQKTIKKHLNNSTLRKKKHCRSVIKKYVDFSSTSQQNYIKNVSHKYASIINCPRDPGSP